MTKLVLTMFMAVLCSVSSYSQTYKSCATVEAHEENLKKDPHYQQRLNSIESHTQLYEMAGGSNLKSTVVTIPVVVHVVYNTAAQNISDAQIQSQIDVLNEDFRKLNVDVSQVPAVWQSLVADTKIEFCLAKRDPQGNPTTGITRTFTTTTAFSSNNAVKYNTSGGKDIWDRNQYLNIWVCNMSGNIAGYAQFPGGNAATDGVVVHYSTFGRTGTLMNGYNKGRVTTHEVGHWLNLRHIWGDALCGNDYVNDTPTQQAANYGCPGYPYVTCSNGPAGDMYMNYMDYTMDACKYMFTLGQSTRMNAVLAPGGFRNSLATSQGCIPPGTTGVCSIPSNLGSSVSTTSALLTWSSTGAVSYTVRYKATTSPTWITITTTSTSASISGLISGASYEFQVQSQCSTTSSAFSSSHIFTTTPVACNPPSGLTVSNVTTSFVTLTWISSGASTYIIRYKPVNGSSWSSLSTSLTSISIGGLTQGVDYEAQVQGICSSSSSAFSSSVFFTIPSNCTVPSGLVATNVGTNSATLSWAGSGASSYNVRYKETTASVWTNTSTNQLNINVSGLNSAANYEFQVQGICSSSASAFSSSATFTTAAPLCIVPGGLTSSGITTTSAILSWQNTFALSYDVRYKPSASNNWITINTLQTSVTLAGLSSNTAYEYQVKANCQSNSSVFSNSALFTTQSPVCSVPSNLNATSVTTTTATLSWSNTGAVNYSVRFKTSAATSWTNTTTSQTSISIGGLQPGTNYEFQVQSNCSSVSSGFSTSFNFSTLSACAIPSNALVSNITSSTAVLSWNSSSGALSYNFRYKAVSATMWSTLNTIQTSVSISGLLSATNYEFQVEAVCSNGTSGYSPSVTFTTGVIQSCNTPSGLYANNITTNSATLNWNASGANSYNVRYKSTTSSVWTNLSTAQTSVNISGLLSGTNYEFQVQGICSTTQSNYSLSNNFTTGVSACIIPSGLSATNITANSATLNWNSSGANSYNVRYKSTSSSVWTNLTSTSTTVSISGLLSGTAYEFQVQGVCNVNTSSYSSSATFTTLVPTCSIPAGITVVSTSSTTATLAWNNTGAVTYNLRFKPVTAVLWSVLTTTQTTVSIAALVAGTNYEFQVQSNCSTTSSGYSESVLFSTTGLLCAVPTGLAANNITISSATLTWLSTGVSSYFVRYKATNSVNWIYLQTSQTSLSVNNLMAGSAYEFQVQSVCGSTSSAYSASATFTTMLTTCGVPSNLNASNLTTTTATLSWNGNGGLSYSVRYKPVSSTSWSYLSTLLSSINVGGLLPGTSYEFQVQANCSNSTSGYSNSHFFNTNTTLTNYVTVGTGTATSEIPYGTAHHDQKVQMFITKAELVAAGFNNIDNRLTSLGFFVTSASAQVMNNFTIKIAHVSTSSFSGNFFINTFGSTTVFSGNVTAVPNSWNTHVFDTPFIYNGVNNILIEICFDNNSSSINSLVRYSVTSQQAVLYNQQSVANSSVCNSNFGVLSNNRPNMRLEFNGSDSRLMHDYVIDEEEVVSDVNISPNPAVTNTTISFNLQKEDNCLIEIYSLDGKKVFTEKINGVEGLNEFTLNMDETHSDFKPGIYLVKIISGGDDMVSKFVVN